MATRLHSVEVTAELLDLSPATVYRLIAAGDLETCDAAPSGSRRPKTRVSDDAIDAFIRARTRKAKQLRAS